MIEKLCRLECLLGSFKRAHTPQVAYELEQEISKLQRNYNYSTYQYYKIRYEQLKTELRETDGIQGTR